MVENGIHIYVFQWKTGYEYINWGMHEIPNEVIFLVRTDVFKINFCSLLFSVNGN